MCRGYSKLFELEGRKVPCRTRNSTHGDFSRPELQGRTLERLPIFVGGSFQAFKRSPFELSTNRHMAYDGTLNLERQVTQGIGLGHEIVLKAASTPAVLTFGQEEVQHRALHWGREDAFKCAGTWF